MGGLRQLEKEKQVLIRRIEDLEHQLDNTPGNKGFEGRMSQLVDENVYLREERERYMRSLQEGE